jgi:hypothetical protein
MPAAVALFLYSVYPFFIMYAASGMKQAIAMAFLLQAYVCLYQRRSIGWIWLFLAVGFHTGAALVFPIIILHLLTFRPQFGKLRALKLSIVILSFSIALSITNLNQIFMSSVQPYLVVSDNYQVYFLDATNFNYRAGFRLDFTIFSVIPILCALWLRKCGNGLSLNKSGWWLNLYILLASLYQIFAFAPYADRFASFGWHIMPFILLIMSSETGMRRVFQILLLIGVPINLALLQFYTLQNIHLDL